MFGLNEGNHIMMAQHPSDMRMGVVAPNSLYGYLVTGPNGNSIFLPAAGQRDGTSLTNAGSSGYYWSSMTGSRIAGNA